MASIKKHFGRIESLAGICLLLHSSYHFMALHPSETRLLPDPALKKSCEKPINICSGFTGQMDIKKTKARVKRLSDLAWMEISVWTLTHLCREAIRETFGRGSNLD